MAKKPGKLFTAPRVLPKGIGDLVQQVADAFLSIEGAFAQLFGKVDEPSRTTDRQTTAATILGKPGDIIQVIPPAAGVPVVLQEATTETLGKTVVVMVEGTLGTVTVTATSSLVQGAVSVVLSGVGVRTFRSDGAGGWWLDRNLITGADIVDGSVSLLDLEPIADETFLGNVSGAPASPSAIALSTLAATSTSLQWDSTNNRFNYVGSTTTLNLGAITGAQGVVDISSIFCGSEVRCQPSAAASIDGFTARTQGFWFLFVPNHSSLVNGVTFSDNVGNLNTSVRTPQQVNFDVFAREVVFFSYNQNRWYAQPGFMRSAGGGGGVSDAYVKTIASYRSV